MIKAVLFDFDGTLINTNDLIFESYRVAFKKVLNREISMDEILSLYGKPLYSSLEVYGSAREDLYNTYREFNAKHHDQMVNPFEGVYDGVKHIKDMGMLTGIVTSKRLHMVERGLNILNMSDMFDVIITPDDTQKTKPDPEPILKGCEKLDVLPENTVYVGDSVFDLEAGRRANTEICAVKYSVTPHEKLLEFNPEYFVDTIEEFAKKLKEKA